MQPHQERVLDEKKELDSKLSNLTEFIHRSPLWNSLSEIEQTLLKNQLKVMTDYSTILGQRIALWEPT